MGSCIYLTFGNIIAILLGYLLGSINPSFILGKVIKGIDLRNYGSKNPGTMNAIHIIGGKWAIIPAIYDPLKGIISIYIAQSLGATTFFAYAAGISALIGHCFPFYLKFKGGEGVATAVGILLWGIYIMVRHSYLPYIDILLLIPFTLSILYVSKSGDITGAFILPFLIFAFLSTNPLKSATILTSIVILFILSRNLIHIYQNNLLNFKDISNKIQPWRFWLRPVSLLFIVFYEIFSKQFVVILMGSVALIFLIMDTVRMLNRGVNMFLLKNFILGFKRKEKHKFSSMTIFLISGTVIFLLFSREIAFTVLVFLIFGDMLAKYFGLRYGRHRFFRKSIEGFLMYFTSCIAIGIVLMKFLPINIYEIALVSFTMSIIEILPLGIDDNLSSSLIGAVVYYVVKKGGV